MHKCACEGNDASKQSNKHTGGHNPTRESRSIFRPLDSTRNCLEHIAQRFCPLCVETRRVRCRAFRSGIRLHEDRGLKTALESHADKTLT